MGVGSVRTAKIIICLVWLFIFLMVVIGNAIHSDKNELYQSPTPVSPAPLSSERAVLNKHRLAVLVLDRPELPAVPHLGRVFLVLDHTSIFFTSIHTPFLLEPGKHYLR